MKRANRIGWTALAAALCLGLPLARADTLLGTYAYNYSGSTQTFTAPAGTSYVIIKVWGGAGAGGSNSYGGGGGFAQAKVAASAGDVFSVNIGDGGWGWDWDDWVGVGAWPDGGAGGDVDAGGGGGSSSVFKSGVNIGAGGGGGGADLNGIYPADPDGYQGGAGTGGAPGGGGGSPGNFGGYPGGGGPNSVTGGTSTSSQGGGQTYAAANNSNPNFTGAGTGSFENHGNPGYAVIFAYQNTAPVITSATPQQNVQVGLSASYTVTGTHSPTSYGASGLPPGLSISAGTGVISGTPTTGGTYSSTITATNADGTGSAALVWAVALIVPDATITPSSIYLSQSVQLTRGGTANFGVLFTDNTVWKPDGTADALGMMSEGGPTSYTPTMIGTYYYQYRVADIYYNYKDELVSFVVSAPGENPPSSVGTTSIGSNFVTLSWSGATAQAGIASYWIYRDGVPIAVITTGTSYLDSTNAGSTAYLYQIVTVDSLGNHSAASSALNVTTLGELELFTPLL